MPIKPAFQGGLELNFSSQREFETIDGVPSDKQAPIIARNAVRFLMMGWTEQWTEFLTPAVVHAIFVARDWSLLKELRGAFQQGFIELFEQLKEKELTSHQKEQANLYLSNCLTLLPYGDLTPYESFKIPQCIEGHWELIEYQVKPIELTNRSGWRRFFIQDKDRVFAYGLEPINNEKAESHLIFMGTTYPAGQGFIPQINADAKGLETVGETLYRTGRKKIHSWLRQQKNKIHVCGVSLGGSLSLLLAIDKGNYTLSRVDALNPAGLQNEGFKNLFDHWDELQHKPEVMVQKQGSDPVSAFGVWKNDWYIIHVAPPKNKQGPNGFLDHFLNYAGFADTTFTYLEAAQDNAKREARNFWIYTIGRSLVYGFCLAPYTYVFRPVYYFLLNNWKIAVPFLGILMSASLIVLGMIPALTFLSVAGGIFLGMLLLSNNKSSKLSPAQAEYMRREDLAQMYDPSLPRNQMMDIYNEEEQMNLNITFEQIHTYYYVMRCLVKEKNFIPVEEINSKHVRGISKKLLLEECSKKANADLNVTFKVTRAKAAHIRHTLTLVQQLGVENESLKSCLEKDYGEYWIGKHQSH